MTEFEIEIESLIGQFCYAFGAGAGRLRVHRETIATLQGRYRPYLQANLQGEAGRKAWADAKFHLLEYVTAMGRYAASMALQAGDMTILPEHFEVAAKRFEIAAHRTRTRAIKAGPWCPPGDPSPDRLHVAEPHTELERGAGAPSHI